jgi:ATP-dependent DNA helicase RecQ
MCDNCLAGEKEQVDITIPAQKFLSCVKRTGERFGAVHVIDVLLGSGNQKVLKYEHQNVSTYGIGKDLTREQWLHISRQLLQKGLLSKDERYGSLRLTASAYEKLRNRDKIEGVLKEAEPVREKKGKTGAIEHDQNLFEILRQKRKELADEAGFPPYVIFSDRTLVEMAAYYPMKESSLLKINGVGQVKLARYGEIFLEIIRQYCQENGLKEIPKGSNSSIDPAQGELGLAPRHIAVGEAYNEGKSVQDLMDEYRVQQETVLNHLLHYVQGGFPLRNGDDLSSLSSLPEQRKAEVLAAFKELGTERLKPVFERFAGAVNYDELKILRLYYLSLASNGSKDPPSNTG